MKAPASEPSVRRRDPAIVLIADHLEARRTLLVESLLFLSDYRIVEATEARTVVGRTRRLRPRVLVMPLSLPGLDEDAAIRGLREEATRRDLRIIGIAERDLLGAEKMVAELSVDVVVHEPCLPSEILEHVRKCVIAAAKPDAAAHAARADRRRPSDKMEVRKSSRARDPRDGRDPRDRDPKAIV